MSKAFTSEETEDTPPLVAPPPVLRPGEKRFITAAGARALQSRLDALQQQRAGLTRGTWDHADRARVLDAGMEALRGTLAVLTVAPEPDAQDPQARLGSRVEVQPVAGGAARHWRLVGPDEADPALSAVSVESPVGRALLGARAGDEVEVDLPRGAQVWRVLRVLQR